MRFDNPGSNHPDAPALLTHPDAVSAAVRIFDRIPHASEHDDILRRAGKTFSANTYADASVRVILLNQLYGTKLLAVGPMAEHICKLTETATAETDWVESIAALPNVGRRMVSFASKYAHFFLDSRRFHISDEAARHVMARHYEVSPYAATKWSYHEFNRRAEALRLASNLPPDRTLDRYLWVAGMRLRELSGTEINRNLSLTFATSECANDLRTLMDAVPRALDNRRARVEPAS